MIRRLQEDEEEGKSRKLRGQEEAEEEERWQGGGGRRRRFEEDARGRDRERNRGDEGALPSERRPSHILKKENGSGGRQVWRPLAASPRHLLALLCVSSSQSVCSRPFLISPPFRIRLDAASGIWASQVAPLCFASSLVTSLASVRNTADPSNGPGNGRLTWGPAPPNARLIGYPVVLPRSQGLGRAAAPSPCHDAQELAPERGSAFKEPRAIQGGYRSLPRRAAGL